MTTMQPARRYTTTINLAITEDLREWIQEQADKNGASLAAAVRFYLEKAREDDMSAK
jgi:hypothetical protein